MPESSRLELQLRRAPAVAAHQHERRCVRAELRECLQCEAMVLPWLECPDHDQVLGREVVPRANGGARLVAARLGEARVAGGRDHHDAVQRHAEMGVQFLPRVLRHRHQGRRVLDAPAVAPGIALPIDHRKELRMGEEEQVVDGHHRRDARSRGGRAGSRG